MKKFFRVVLPAIVLLVVSSICTAQQLQTPVGLSANSGSLTGSPDRYGRPAPDSRAWSDPALNHNRVLQNTEGMYKLIGPYKVIGSSFLFGEHHKGDMFSSEAKAYNIYLSYNTYNQEVEFYSTANPDKSLVREPGTLDSFTIHQDTSFGIMKPLKFIYGTHLGAKDKYYFMEMYAGTRFSLYKRYKSDLDYVASNLGQSELRQFDLQSEYFYHDKETKGVRKLKPNAGSLIKEFKSVKDLSAELSNDDFSYNPEDGMRKAFKLLDKN